MKLKKKKHALVPAEKGKSTSIKISEYKGELDKSKVFDVKDNIKGVKGRIPQIKIIHKAQMFEDAAGIKTETVKCIIIHHSPANAWWEKPFSASGGGNLPDCFAPDAEHPESTKEGGKVQAKNCMICKLNKFKSAVDEEGKPAAGKACKNMWRLHILIAKQLLPKRITLPPSNLKVIQDFLVSLLDNNIPHEAAIVELSLRKTQNKKGIDYSEVVIKPLRVITDEARLLDIKKIKDQSAQAFGEIATAEEYAENQ